ncbi:MAG: hypothetical protein ACOYB3_00455 [Azonexus sp.]
MSRLAERMTGAKIEPWIGVDLDGTLARQPEDKKYVPDVIGEPVKAMLDRVKEWVKAGKKVKIFTARADDEIAVNAIKKWLKKHDPDDEYDLGDLEVTNLKDCGMTELWDDRAVAVEKNTGKVSESIVDILLEAGTWTEYWLSPKPELIQAVPGHVAWAIHNVLREDEWEREVDGKIRGAYASMRRRGWARVVIEHGHIYVDPSHCSRSMMAELEYAADDRRCIVTDDKTGRELFNPSRPDGYGE